MTDSTKGRIEGIITLTMLRNWTPIALSLLATGIALFNYIADTQTRLTVLEITVRENVITRLEEVETQTERNTDRIVELERNQP